MKREEETPAIPGMRPADPPGPTLDTRYAHRLYTRDVCELYSVSVGTLYRWLRQGRFPQPAGLNPRLWWRGEDLPLLDGGPYPPDTFPRLHQTERMEAAHAQWQKRRVAEELRRQVALEKKRRSRAAGRQRPKKSVQPVIPGHETPRKLPAGRKGGAK